MADRHAPAAPNPFEATFERRDVALATMDDVSAHARATLVAGEELADLREDASWMLVITRLAETNAPRDDAPSADALYARLLPHAGRSAMLVPARSVGSVDMYLGHLAGLLRRWDQAERHFEAALETNARMRARPQLAIAQYHYAQMLIARDRPDDGPRIVTLLDEAIAGASELGMPALVESARTLLTTHGSVGGAGRTRHANPSASAVGCVFRKEGDYWTIAHRGRIARLKHRKGFDYLARLLRQPERELAALDLVGGARHERSVLSAATADGCGPALDRAARDQYRRRHADLRAQLADAERLNDLLLASRLREEVEMLADQLAAAAGIGGRSRRTGSAERSRSTATKCIRAAIDVIQQVDPVLGRYLATHVRTGYVCVYQPDLDHPIVFQP